MVYSECSLAVSLQPSTGKNSLDMALDENPDPVSHPCWTSAFDCKIDLVFHGIGWGLHQLHENQECCLKSTVERVTCRAVFALWEKIMQLRVKKYRNHSKMD